MFRGDRREVFGTIRGTWFMPITLAVFGNPLLFGELEPGRREEKATDKKLTEMAESQVNRKAA
jgi:hypothetical protein